MHFINPKENVRKIVCCIAIGIGMLAIPMSNVQAEECIPTSIEDMQEGELLSEAEINFDDLLGVLKEKMLTSQSEGKDFVLKVAELEAGNQGIYGKQLVLETIRNRMEDPCYPNNPIEVCTQKGQFATVRNGVPIKNGSLIEMQTSTPEMEELYRTVFIEGANETERLLQEAAFEKGLCDEKYWKGGALFFSNLGNASEPKGVKVYVKIGDHTFWRC